MTNEGVWTKTIKKKKQLSADGDEQNIDGESLRITHNVFNIWFD